MVTPEILIGITVFAMFSILAIVTIIVWNKNTIPNANDGMPIFSPGFLTSCLGTGCSTGLECDFTTFLCKYTPGTPCFASFECANEYFCSGVCVSGEIGGLNQYCPCDDGYICDLQKGGDMVCKGASGTTCGTGLDCFSEICNISQGQTTGTCAGGFPLSYPCISDSQCESLNCSENYCQPIGIITGTIGSSCAGDCVGWIGSSCSATGSACICSEDNEPGICMEYDIGFLAPCVPDYGVCADIFSCYNPTGGTDLYCYPGDTGCICSFYTASPSYGPTACIGGMTALSFQPPLCPDSGMPCLYPCVNDIGRGCNSGGLFVCSTACNGLPVLTTFKFDSSTGLFINATSMSVNPIANLPTRSVNSTKMFSSSTGTVDTIYLVDLNLGLLSMQYDTASSTVISNWTTLIPITQTISGLTFTFKDAAYNGTIFIVVYHTSNNFDVLYSGTSLNHLTPYNVNTAGGFNGPPGTQYSVSRGAIPIMTIDISKPNDAGNVQGNLGPNVIIISPINGSTNVNLYSILNLGVAAWVPAVPLPFSASLGGGNNINVVNSKPSFYYDITEYPSGTGYTGSICPNTATNTTTPIKCPPIFNFAYIGPFTNSVSGENYPNILQFSGNITGVVVPVDQNGINTYSPISYSIYSPENIGMQKASIAIISSVTSTESQVYPYTLTFTYAGITFQHPYFVNEKSIPLATANAFYVLDPSSCS